MKTRTIPADSTYNVVTYDILIDGKPVDPGYQVLSITIVKEANRIPSARVIFRDGQAAEETFPISEKENFIPGKSITIKIGRDRQNAQLFKGIIAKHGIRLRESGASELVLDCRDECVKMTLGRKNRYFEDSKDSEAIEQLIAGYGGLKPDVEATRLKHKELIQFHCTDWDFMLSRAEMNGRLVIADDGAIQVKSPETTATPAVSVLFGATLLEFDAEMDARAQWRYVDARSWDYAGQTLFENSTDSVPVKEPGNVSGEELARALNIPAFDLRHSGQVLEDELREWAKSTLQRSRLAKIQGRAKFIGFAGVKPGKIVELQGLGARFNGKAFVSAVRHDIHDGQWTTQVQFGLPSDCVHQSALHIADTPAAGLLPPIHGLQIGKVVQLQQDPDGEHRILVRLPVVDNAARGVWARIASLDAGKERGAFFMPEIDDEVIVGFINDDPRDAVVLGMLYSSAKPAPLQAQDANHEKGIFTRSKMRIHFHDETKTITIDTSAGNSIVLDEKSKSITITDQNGNTAKMEPSGIQMKSPGNITIEATGKIDIKASAALTIGAAQMTISSQGPMEVKGATAKLSSPGITEISGSLVKIN
ncbi:MAG: type VI secretion system tip protein VgrG [Saprospirales bacterium]|nr:type VI secretion system tip protein VgrG [Saprospirales bacterium]MBK8922853.1 type VI secretion system tip protein VgrG [Saprospirales bacterium]